MHTETMDVSAETILNKDLRFSYKSFGSPSELADGSSPNGFTKNHDEGVQPHGKQWGCWLPYVVD